MHLESANLAPILLDVKLVVLMHQLGMQNVIIVIKENTLTLIKEFAQAVKISNTDANTAINLIDNMEMKKNFIVISAL